MNDFAITFKELEVAGFQFEYDMSSIMLEDEIFTESGGGSEKENFFVRLKNAVITFIDKVIKGIKDFFNKFTTSKAAKNIEDAMKKNPAVAKVKVKTTDWKKSHVLNKETQKKLKNAKSKEEVDKIMSDYKRKRNGILGAAAAVTISLGVLYAGLKKGSNKAVSEMEEQKQNIDYVEVAQNEIKVATPKPSSQSPDEETTKPKTEPKRSSTTPQKSKSDSSANTVIELEKAKAANDAQLRKNDVADTANEVKEAATKISDDAVKALMNRMNSSAIPIPEVDNHVNGKFFDYYRSLEELDDYAVYNKSNVEKFHVTSADQLRKKNI